MNNINLFAGFGKKSSLLKRGVSAAENGNGLTSEKRSVTNGTIGNAFADELVFIRQTYLPVLNSGCDYNRLCFVLALLGNNGFAAAVIADFRYGFHLNIRAL